MPAKQHIGIYAPSGYGKTSLLGTFIEGYHQQNPEKVIRLVTAESAQTPSILRRHLEAGYLQMWPIDSAAYPFERVTDAVTGAWAKDLDDPVGKPIQAFIYEYVGICPLCKKEVYRAMKMPALPNSVVCKCQPNQPPVPVRVVRTANPENGLDKVGAYIFEGGTAFGELFMDRMAALTAKGEKIGGDAAVKFKDGEYDVGGSTQNHYGTAQRQIKQKVQESRLLPVDFVIWTFTKEMGTDDNSRVAVYGPKLPGSAATPDVPRWFGPMLSIASLDSGERRLYLKPFKEDWNAATSKLVNVVNNRIPPEMLGVPSKMWPSGVPDYVKFEAGNKTLLWDVLQEIELRQLGKVGANGTEPKGLK